MAKRANPRRYAQAVFEIALEKKELDTVAGRPAEDCRRGQIRLFSGRAGRPKIKIEDKSRFLKERLGDINPLALNLALLAGLQIRASA